MVRRFDKNTRMWNILVILVSVLLSILIIGCTSVRITMTPRSSLEQQLLVQGLERAMAQINIDRFKGKRVALELVGLTKDDLSFTKESVRIWMAKHGIRIDQDQKEIDLILKVFARVLAVDQSETLFGTPEFFLLGIPIPAIVIYRNIRNRGRADLQIYAWDERSEMLVDELPIGIGETKYDQYTILFIISWTSTDLDKKPKALEK